MSDRQLRWCFRAAIAVPMLIAVAVLLSRRWAPVLDLAMTELRVRDVGTRHTPLIGLPGRIGQFPDQGSHPGPWSFYVLAVVYRLTGGSARSLLLGTTLLNVGAAWAALWVGWRRATRREVVAVGLLVTVAVAWFGASLLTQPWNPYLPLVPFLVVLISTWSALKGDAAMLVVLVAAASFCAQTHVPYLTLCVAMVAVALVTTAWTTFRPGAATTAAERRIAGRSMVGSVVLAAVLWFPVALDQFFRSGNVEMLRRHFLDPPEAPQGFAVGARTVLAHLDVLHLVVSLMSRSGEVLPVLDDLEGGAWWRGAILLTAAVATAGVALRRRDRSLLAVHAVAGVGLVVALMSTARIFGKVWYYLTLWAWSIGLLALVAVVLTLWPLVAERWGRNASRLRNLSVIGQWTAGVVAVVVTVAFVIDAVRVDLPEAHLSEVLAAIDAPTAQALVDGVGAAVGPEGTYAVVWADAAYFGSQGYGLVNELERRGLDARGYPTYRVPLTPWRTATVDEVDAEVVLVTGTKIARWSAVPGVVKVADVEPRSPIELAEYARLRAAAIARLEAAGLDDLVERVDENLFGASIDPRTPPEVQDLLAEMLMLGQRTVVFIVPPGTFDANP